tara:strand:+ start:518 stop:742 length:225 start_codon:yes stop_codon:yes gene_type:complete
MIATEKQLKTLTDLVRLPKQISGKEKVDILMFIKDNANTIGGACELCDDLSTQQLGRMIVLFQHELKRRKGETP